MLAERQGFYLANEGERDEAEVTEEFLAQYYARGAGGAAAGRRRARSCGTAPSLLAEALSSQRGGQVEVRVAERGDKRRLRELAERNAKLALAQDKLRPERRRQQRVDALSSLQEALGLESLPVRIEGFDISNLGPRPHGRLDGRLRGRRAEEVRLPPVQVRAIVGGRPRGERRQRARRLRVDGGGARAARGSSCSSRPTSRRTTPSATRASPRFRT